MPKEDNNKEESNRGLFIIALCIGLLIGVPTGWSIGDSSRSNQDKEKIEKLEKELERAYKIRNNQSEKDSQKNASDTTGSAQDEVSDSEAAKAQDTAALESDTDRISSTGVAGEYKHKAEISQEAIEDYCQDAGLLQKYISLDDYAVIRITNYNVYFDDMGTYDKDGRGIYLLEWNGTRKVDGEQVRFACWVGASSSDDIELYYLSLNGSALFGSIDFDQYDKAGDKII